MSFLLYRFCCAYIAFKTEEYNVTIDEFVQILPNDFQESIASLVLQNEVCRSIIRNNFFIQLIFLHTTFCSF